MEAEPDSFVKHSENKENFKPINLENLPKELTEITEQPKVKEAIKATNFAVIKVVD